MTYQVKLYKVQKYLSLTGHLYSAGAFVMNEEFYRGLPEDIRIAIDKAAVVAREAGIEEVAATEKAWLSEMEAQIQINVLGNDQILAFREIAKADWPNMAKVIGKDYFNTIHDKIEEIQDRVGR
jgi:TRAP-type C4-dicarboxylate transport system substrate-binding protein